jgi:hypothetical protein
MSLQVRLRRLERAVPPDDPAELALWTDCFRDIPSIVDPAATAEGFLRHCRSIGEPPSMAVLARLAGEVRPGG